MSTDQKFNIKKKSFCSEKAQICFTIQNRKSWGYNV